MFSAGGVRSSVRRLPVRKQDRLTIFILATSMLVALSTLQVAAQSADPVFSHPTRILNPYLPFATLKQDILIGRSGGQSARVERSTLNRTKTFMVHGKPVQTMVVVDKDFVAGKLEEVPFDYFAESDDGAVYYFGEDVNEYQNGKIVGHRGAWHYGVDTSHLGMIIPGRPQVGQKFQAENVPGITLENDEIVSTTAKIRLGIGSYQNVVKIKESYPDGSVEYKYYVPSVGTVTEIAPDGTVNLRQHISCWQLGTPSDPDGLIRP